MTRERSYKRKLDFLGRPSCIITLFMCFEFFTIGLKPSFELWKEGGGGRGRYIKRSPSLGPRLGPNWLSTLWPWVNNIHLFVGSSGMRSHTKWVKLGSRFWKAKDHNVKGWLPYRKFPCGPLNKYYLVNSKVGWISKHPQFQSIWLFQFQKIK